MDVLSFLLKQKILECLALLLEKVHHVGALYALFLLPNLVVMRYKFSSTYNLVEDGHETGS